MNVYVRIVNVNVEEETDMDLLVQALIQQEALVAKYADLGLNDRAKKARPSVRILKGRIDGIVYNKLAAERERNKNDLARMMPESEKRKLLVKRQAELDEILGED